MREASGYICDRNPNSNCNIYAYIFMPTYNSDGELIFTDGKGKITGSTAPYIPNSDPFVEAGLAVEKSLASSESRNASSSSMPHSGPNSLTEWFFEPNTMCIGWLIGMVIGVIFTWIKVITPEETVVTKIVALAFGAIFSGFAGQCCVVLLRFVWLVGKIIWVLGTRCFGRLITIFKRSD